MSTHDAALLANFGGILITGTHSVAGVRSLIREGLGKDFVKEVRLVASFLTGTPLYVKSSPWNLGLSAGEVSLRWRIVRDLFAFGGRRRITSYFRSKGPLRLRLKEFRLETAGPLLDVRPARHDHRERKCRPSIGTTSRDLVQDSHERRPAVQSGPPLQETGRPDP